MKKRLLLVSLITFFSCGVSFSAIFECSYVNKNGATVLTSFNPADKNRKDYNLVYQAYKNGQCDELMIKKYFFYGSTCNIQIKKKTKKASGYSCYGGNYSAAIKEVRAIAKKEFGYY